MADAHESLVSAAARGDAAALNALFEKHLPSILAYVRVRAGPRLRAMESSFDLVQSACREVLQDLPSFEYRDEAGFRQWLYTAAERKVLDRARYHARERRDPARARSLSREEAGRLSRAYESVATPSGAAQMRDSWRAVEDALEKLSPPDREVIVLAHLVGLPRSEIARRQNRSEGAVKVHLHRALAQLALLVGSER